MKQVRARVTTKGQVTIPAEIRHLLSIQPHDTVEFVVDGSDVRVTRIGSVVERTAGALRTDALPLAVEDLRRVAEEAIAEETVKRGPH